MTHCLRFSAIALGILSCVLRHPGANAQAPGDVPFRNPDLRLEQRVDDLVGRLTLDEKVSLMIDRTGEIARLGIPTFPWWNEALHGVARAGRATVFPQAIGLAATWDTALMHRIATAISDEARAMHNGSAARGKRNLYQGLVFWSPNINIFRDPRWGRGHETYGEDPFLTSAMGVAFVRGMQGDDPRFLKTVSTAKHFAIHSGPEPLRHSFDARVSPIDLWDTYLPAFRALVVEGGAASVMCAYNAVDGLPACASPELLDGILRKRWGFKGYVVSDCGAVDDIHQFHRKQPTAAASAVAALRAGTDLECSAGSWSAGSPDAFTTLIESVRDGAIPEALVDTAVRRLLHAQFRLGVYDPPERVPWSRYTYADIVNSPAHQALALDAARKSIVLLKNDHATLPLKTMPTTIAVIGPNAADTDVLVGNYAGTPVAPVSVLAGITAAVGTGTKVLYARGSPLATGIPSLRPVPTSALFTGAGAERRNGLSGAYFAGHFDGAAVFTRVDAMIHFDWADNAPDRRLDDDGFSVRWKGEIVAPTTGRYTLAARCTTQCRLFVNDRPIATGRSDHEPVTAIGAVQMRAGVSYPIRLEVEHEKYDAIAELLWEPPASPGVDEVADAVAVAKQADVVVLVLGLSSQLEGEESGASGGVSAADVMRLDDVNVRREVRQKTLERVAGFAGGDRTSLDLPRVQQNVLERVVAAVPGKPVVLVLLNGSAVAVEWADRHVAAIVEAWYPGQAAGTAIADVLFGRVSPGGRLPVTFYRSVDQLPPFDDYSMAGRTYRYFAGEPLYPFGHGLSYSTFAYSGLSLPARAAVGAPVPVAVEVRNSGAMTADEVVQVYVSSADATRPVPIRSLRAFERVTLAPGERRVVRFTLDDRAFSSVDADGTRRASPGRFQIAVGGKQPGQKGAADSAATMVLTGAVERTGAVKTLEP